MVELLEDGQSRWRIFLPLAFSVDRHATGAMPESGLSPVPYAARTAAASYVMTAGYVEGSCTSATL